MRTESTQATLPGVQADPEPGEKSLIEDAEEFAFGAESNLPDIPGITWGLRRRTGKTVTVDGDELSTPAGVDSERPPNGEYPADAILSGVSHYLDTYGETLVEIPDYYSRFTDFSPIVAQWTVGHKSVGLGLGPNLLRGLVRLANGKGRIDHELTNVVVCKNATVLATGPRGAFVTDCWTISPERTDDSPPESAYHTIRGFSIPEEAKPRRELIDRLLVAFETHTPFSVEAYEYDRENANHQFQTEGGLRFRPHGSALRNARPKEEILGTKETTIRGEDYEVDIEAADIETDVGDPQVYTTTSRAVVVGYSFEWVPQEYVFSGGIRCLDATVTTISLQYPTESDEGDLLDYRVLQDNQTVESFDIK